jgi:Raf kinase inhibitor-like YbhB/YbcL family protein
VRGKLDPPIDATRMRSIAPSASQRYAAAWRQRYRGANTVKAITGYLLNVGIALFCLSVSASAIAADEFSLSSPSFEDNGKLAVKNAGNDKSNPNCVGENISPPLEWKNPPAGTKSFALILFDPEGRAGLGVVHWVAYGIPASVTRLVEGEASKPSEKFRGGKGTRNLDTYSGPCTPPGDWHHYTFTLIATDLDPTALQPGMTRDELLAALSGHAKGAAGLIGRFRHQ